MNTTKLTRAEACAGLARRMGWTHPEFKGEILTDAWLSPSGRMEDALPDFFNSRDAAAELVEWVSTQDGSFVTEFCEKLDIEILALPFYSGFAGKLSMSTLRRFCFLLATPEQITLAGCAALGIEVEDEAR